jgi:hypothetical protein
VARRRPFNPFSMSFLDCICCGFGAIILLYVIVNARAAAERSEVIQDRRAEVSRLEFEIFKGRRNLTRYRNDLRETVDEMARTEGRSREIIERIREIEAELATSADTTLATTEHVDRLKADLKSLEEEMRRLEGAIDRVERQGERLKEFKGTGDRHYVTGLKVGGQRILILLDCSASMLDDTVLGVLRRRNLPDAERRRAEKWRQALRTVDWLTTQFPSGSRFQVIGFNESAFPLDGRTSPTGPIAWLDASLPEDLARPTIALADVVPEKGTSLRNAFDAIARLDSKPDNIILITDGLPTVDQRPPRGYKVSARKRLTLFNRARGRLPSGVPVNVILLPMEGDPMASAAFWRLAIDTRGSFFCPAGDWP